MRFYCSGFSKWMKLEHRNSTGKSKWSHACQWSPDSETDTNVTHSKKNKSEAGCVVAVDSERSDESGTDH